MAPGRAAQGLTAAINPGRQLGRLGLTVRRERHVGVAADAAAAGRRLRSLPPHGRRRVRQRRAERVRVVVRVRTLLLGVVRVRAALRRVEVVVVARAAAVLLVAETELAVHRLLRATLRVVFHCSQGRRVFVTLRIVHTQMGGEF